MLRKDLQYTFTQSTATVTLVPVKSCSLSSTFSDDTYDKWLLGARTCTVVADLTVLGLTCMHTRSASVLGRTVGMKRTFSGTLMRDGTLYFLALSVVNIVGLGLWHREEVIEPITTWTAVLTAIMTSRFMLDLHEVSRATSTSIRTTFSLGEHSGSGRQNGTLAFMHGVEESAVSRIADEISGIHVYGNMTGIDGVDGDRLGGEAQWDEDWDEGDEQEGCHETSYGYAI
ncbi:hypothetical protein BD414DRAFT_495968 [Trametes punicea]|nr:hypothetical protein BD414DRAFT_495968 [Trametes punicea]